MLYTNIGKTQHIRTNEFYSSTLCGLGGKILSDKRDKNLKLCTKCVRFQNINESTKKLGTKKEITIGDIIAAAEENGYVHAHDAYFKYDQEGVIVQACVMGQIGLNLGVDAFALAETLNKEAGNRIGSRIIQFNDSRMERGRHNYRNVVKFVKELLSEFDPKISMTVPAVEYRSRKKGAKV